MHYRLEIVMPPVDDVNAAVSEIMAPFDENAGEDISSGHGFWDFWVIGGRYSGRKMEQSIGDDKIAEFTNKLRELNVTCSGLVCGKQELSPASQIPMVDQLWRDMFPDSGSDKCPLFAHSNDQYDSSSTLPGDICTLKDVPENTTCLRVIIAGESWDGQGLEAKFMAQDSFWNGVNHIDTTWDKTLKSAISQYADSMKRAKPEYLEKHLPKEDWIVVTVDYHS